MKNRHAIATLFCALLALHGSAQTNYVRKNVSLKVKTIVHQLDKYDRISGALIGHAPRKPKQYELFEKLKSKASESELFELTNHPNPSVRAYGYWALVENNSPKALEVIVKNQSDTVLVYYHYGCTGRQKRLIEFMTDFVPSYAKRNNIALTPEINAIVERENEAWNKREMK